MKNPNLIAVASRSFCANPVLRQELEARYSQITWNTTGRVLEDAELIEFLKGHTKAITGLEKINRSILSGVPELKHIAKYGVGMDMIELADLESMGVTLGWISGVNRRAVSELTLNFMLTLIRGVHLSTAHFRNDEFKRAPGRQLTEKTVGIIGCGNIGKELVKFLRPFSCRVLVHDIVDYPEFYQEYGVKVV
ncbi:MAG: phosphoglycerate dehydrogenase, partial [Proteobacteria bacterium]